MSNPVHETIERRATPFIAAASALSLATTWWRSSAEPPGGGVTCRLGDGTCAAAHQPAIAPPAQGVQLHRSVLSLQRSFGNHFVGVVLRQAAGQGAPSGADPMESVERTIERERGGGQGMDDGVRSRMERSFGADFSAVRVHTDATADGLSRALSARAFATGHDVFFRQGEYEPGSSVGRELLAHELTHVVQQTGTGVRRKMTVSQPDDPHEVEADRMARHVMQQEQLSRQPEADGDEREDEG